jgi:2-keto-4-pentenoate hydratase/2-oxohepta-3-ene-1,7-dioic acid hydratase in catechol pathway
MWVSAGGVVGIALALFVLGPFVVGSDPGSGAGGPGLAQSKAQPGRSGTQYVRFDDDGHIAYGVLAGDRVRELSGSIFDAPEETGRTLDLADVTLLVPTEPTKVIAVGLNYQSHAGSAATGDPPIFVKFPSSLIAHEEPLVVPADAGDPHYEGEMVIVIGKRVKHISEAQVRDHVFGVTAGNDISERDWQAGDLQWLRGKATDGFGPVGPVITTGLDYDDLLVETRVNGEVRQSERTRNMIHSVDKVVSFLSRYFTLEPGDLIFTGTPDSTQGLKEGDVVEVEVEGVGVLRTPVTREAP